MSVKIFPELDHGVAKAANRDLILADLRAFLAPEPAAKARAMA